MENELAKDPSTAEDLHSDSISLALFCNPTLDPALVPALILALVPAPALALSSSDKLFRQFIKA